MLTWHDSNGKLGTRKIFKKMSSQYLPYLHRLWNFQVLTKANRLMQSIWNSETMTQQESMKSLRRTTITSAQTAFAVISHNGNWNTRIGRRNIPGQAEAIIGRDDLHVSSSDIFLYRDMNSLQDSISDKSLLQLVSNTAFTPNDLRNVVSFLKTWKLEQKHHESPS